MVIDKEVVRSAISRRSDKDHYGLSGSFVPSDGADNSILLIDLSAETVAQWAHKAGSYIKLQWFHIAVDIGGFTGEIYLGWVKEVDGTNGSIYIIKAWDHVQGDFVETIDFGDRPWICHSDFQKYQISGDYTVLQNDTAYDLGVNATLPNAAVGDLVLIYDYADAEITRMDVAYKFSIV